MASWARLWAARGARREADAAQAWAAARVFLERHDVARRNFRPAEAAARAVLATGTQIRLPQWLVARFVRGRNEGETKGMAARDANPAALLRVYLAHNRLEEAARLAVAEVAAARRASHGAHAELRVVVPGAAAAAHARARARGARAGEPWGGAGAAAGAEEQDGGGGLREARGGGVAGGSFFYLRSWKKKNSISVRRSQRIVSIRTGLSPHEMASKKKKNQNGDNNGSSDASLSH